MCLIFEDYLNLSLGVDYLCANNFTINSSALILNIKNSTEVKNNFFLNFLRFKC
jgi:hypothetical protein